MISLTISLPNTYIGTLISAPLGAHTSILNDERTASRPDTPNDQSPNAQRRQREKPSNLSDDSLPDINDLLWGDEGTQKRIEEGAKRKFNLVTNKSEC